MPNNEIKVHFEDMMWVFLCESRLRADEVLISRRTPRRRRSPAPLFRLAGGLSHRKAVLHRQPHTAVVEHREEVIRYRYRGRWLQCCGAPWRNQPGPSASVFGDWNTAARLCFHPVRWTVRLTVSITGRCHPPPDPGCWLSLSVCAQHPYLHPREWPPPPTALFATTQSGRSAAGHPSAVLRFGEYFSRIISFLLCLGVYVRGGRGGPRCRRGYNNGSKWPAVVRLMEELLLNGSHRLKPLQWILKNKRKEKKRRGQTKQEHATFSGLISDFTHRKHVHV